MWNLGFLVWFVLIKVLASKASYCKKPSSSPEIRANITCDRTLTVFVDGQQVGLESQGYDTVTNYVIAANSSVIGLSCDIGNGDNGGILGSFSNGVITNASWRCSDLSASGWSKAGFDDSSWLPAISHSINSYDNHTLSVPRGPLFQIADGAAWIWTANNSISNSKVYCRYDLSKEKISCYEGPNADLYRSEVIFMDRSLQGSVLMTTKASSSIQCALRCQRTTRCKSFNFEYGSEIVNPKICELNSNSASVSPNDVIERKGFMYYDGLW